MRDRRIFSADQVTAGMVATTEGPAAMDGDSPGFSSCDQGSCSDPDSIEWEPTFERQEFWVMNTEFTLFGSDTGPEVSEKATHWKRFDEMSKCVAASPGNAAVRLFYADGVVSIAGPSLGDWMSYVGKRAPSEQQIVKFILPNMEAAWRGEERTRNFKQAAACWNWYTGDWRTPEELVGVDTSGQPTPGVFVHRNVRREDENWETGVGTRGSRNWQDWNWPKRPTVENLSYYLSRLPGASSGCSNGSTAGAACTASDGNCATVGALLDIDGAELRFLSGRPLSTPTANCQAEPETCVTVLGGPKGISDTFKDVIRESFAAHAVPLVEVNLGPCEQMAHVCIGYLRIHDDSGRYRASLVDLKRLGKDGYEEMVAAAEASFMTLTPASSAGASVATSEMSRKSRNGFPNFASPRFRCAKCLKRVRTAGRWMLGVLRPRSMWKRRRGASEKGK